MERVNALETLASVDLSQTIPPDLCRCFSQMKAKTALPDTAIDGVAFFKYEEKNYAVLS